MRASERKNMREQYPYLGQLALPLIEPFTVAEVRLACRFSEAKSDGLIAGLITAARKIAEEYMQRSLLTQTWLMEFQEYIPEAVKLPKGPIQRIVRVRVIDENWQIRKIRSSNYILESKEEQLKFKRKLIGRIGQIEFVAGYVSAAEIPTRIRSGLMNHIAAMLENGGEAVALPTSAKRLFDHHRSDLI
jgi:uncharacterized phiE125 gp8 family phage protein